MSGGDGATVLRTADGLDLAARWWSPPGPETAGAVVIVHGFSGGQGTPEVRRLAGRLAARGWRVLTFDLRGHGSSAGQCTLGWREHLDVDAAVAAARLDHDVVLVVGTSLGGIATVDHLAGESPADAGVVVGTPARWQIPRSWSGLLSVALTQTPPGRALVTRRTGTRLAARTPRGDPPVARMRDVRGPVAVIHGLGDRFLAPAAAHALYAAAPEPRRLDLVPGMGHGFVAEALAPIEAAVAWAAAAAATPSPDPQS